MTYSLISILALVGSCFSTLAIADMPGGSSSPGSDSPKYEISGAAVTDVLGGGGASLGAIAGIESGAPQGWSLYGAAKAGFAGSFLGDGIAGFAAGDRKFFFAGGLFGKATPATYQIGMDIRFAGGNGRSNLKLDLLPLGFVQDRSSSVSGFGSGGTLTAETDVTELLKVHGTAGISAIFGPSRSPGFSTTQVETKQPNGTIVQSSVSVLSTPGAQSGDTGVLWDLGAGASLRLGEKTWIDLSTIYEDLSMKTAPGNPAVGYLPNALNIERGSLLTTAGVRGFF